MFKNHFLWKPSLCTSFCFKLELCAQGRRATGFKNMLLVILLVSTSAKYASPDPWQAVKNILLTIPLVSFVYKSIWWTSPDPWPLLGYQGVTTRCRLSLLANSALVILVQCGGSCGVLANEYSCAHHVTWSPNKLWRSTFIFNLRWIPFVNRAYSKATHNSTIFPLFINFMTQRLTFMEGDTPLHGEITLYHAYISEKN